MSNKKRKNSAPQDEFSVFRPPGKSTESLLHQLENDAHELDGKDLKSVFQELQVHQIELEMQNDELRLVNLELEKQKGRFSAIYDEAPVGYFILDHAGVIKDVNATGLELLEYPLRKAIKGNRLHSYVSGDDSENYYRFFMHLLKKRTPQQCELKMRTIDDTPLYTRLQGTVQPGEHDVTECYIAMVDITERKRFEQELAATKERLELSLKASLAGTWELDLKTLNFFLDDSSHRICNLGSRNFAGSLEDFLQLIHPEYRQEIGEKFDTSIRNNKEIDVIARFGDNDARDCYTVIRGHTIPDQDVGTRLVGIIMDITEKTHMEMYSRRLVSEQQKRIAVATLTTEESERRRISGVLHDSVSQLLYGIKMKLRQFGKDKNANEEITAINDLLDEAITETRDISFELAPSILADFGLVATVEELTRRLSSEDMKISLKTVGVISRMDLLLETNIYRIVQELINNALKHSGASNLNIEIRSNNLIEIIVKDNGKGFDVKVQEACASGSGLSSIKNRLSLYNGKLHIKSVIGTGTTIHIKLSADIAE